MRSVDSCDARRALSDTAGCCDANQKTRPLAVSDRRRHHGDPYIRGAPLAAPNRWYRIDAFIYYPGYSFQVVDALVTNFHLPKSTLMMLVCAFGGFEPVMRAYAEAVKESYRFFSYGDAMFIERIHV